MFPSDDLLGLTPAGHPLIGQHSPTHSPLADADADAEKRKAVRGRPTIAATTQIQSIDIVIVHYKSQP
jgi:hypothetical protein